MPVITYLIFSVSEEIRTLLKAQWGPEVLQDITSERWTSVDRAEVQWLVINHRSGQLQTLWGGQVWATGLHHVLDLICALMFLFSWFSTHILFLCGLDCSIFSLVFSRLGGWNMLCGYILIDWLAAKRRQVFLLLIGPCITEGSVPI